MSIVKLDSYKKEKLYKNFYIGHPNFANDSAFLLTNKRSQYLFRKKYVADYIKLLTSNNKKDGE